MDNPESPQIEISSRIVGDHRAFIEALNLDTVNRELGPWIRMTAPPEFRHRSILQWPTGQYLFSSWILFLGVIPIDRHHFTLESIDPETGFSECSCTWTMAEWRHKRIVTVEGKQLQITDRVRYRTRLPGLGLLLRPVYRAVFSHRHRRLRSDFAGDAQRSH